MNMRTIIVYNNNITFLLTSIHLSTNVSNHNNSVQTERTLAPKTGAFPVNRRGLHLTVAFVAFPVCRKYANVTAVVDG